MNLDNDKEKDLKTEEDLEEEKEEGSLKPEEIEKRGFGRLISFIKFYIFGRPDSFYETKRLLKATEKKIKRITPLIYDTKREQITPKFIRIVYEIYKIVYPAKPFIDSLRDPKALEILQIHFIENYLTEEQRKLLESLSKENIINEIMIEGLEKAEKNISKKENAFVKSFSKNLILEISEKYSALMELIDIISFDYYPLLKKFNKNLQEDYLVDNPSFSSVYGKYVIEELKGLSATIDTIDLDAPFSKSVEDFNRFRNRTLLIPSEVDRLIGIIKRLVSNEYLPLIIKLVDKNPFYRPPDPKAINVNIFQNYTKIISSRITESINAGKQDKIKGEVGIILNSLFGKTDFQTLKNYISEKDVILNRLGVGSFVYADALNYLRYFLMERYNRYIRECINSLIVGAKFYQSDNLQNLSNNFYSANELIKAIMSLDESLNENEPRGGRFKTLLRRAASEQQAKKLSSEYIEQINEEASKIIMSAIRSINFIINIISKILEETKTKNYTIVANIREVQGVRNKEFLEDLEKSLGELKGITKLMEIYLNIK